MVNKIRTNAQNTTMFPATLLIFIKNIDNIDNCCTTIDNLPFLTPSCVLNIKLNTAYEYIACTIFYTLS